MRRVFLIPIVILGLSASAQNYFKEGMHWEEMVSSTSSWEIQDYIINYYLGESQEIAGKTAFRLYASEELENNNAELITYVYSDGNKVYSLNLKDEWVLMYDFGLEPEENVEVWTPANMSLNHECRGPYNVNCLGKETLETVSGTVEAILVYEERMLDQTYKVYWIKGIGSTMGVTNNCEFELDGSGSKLIRAYVDGTVLYESADGSSIKGLEQDHESHESFYTLKGERVASPEGIVIRVKDGKAVKTVFR